MNISDTNPYIVSSNYFCRYIINRFPLAHGDGLGPLNLTDLKVKTASLQKTQHPAL